MYITVFFLLLCEEHNTLSSFAGQKRIVKIDIKLKELLAYSQILLTWTLFWENVNKNKKKLIYERYITTSQTAIVKCRQILKNGTKTAQFYFSSKKNSAIHPWSSAINSCRLNSMSAAFSLTARNSSRSVMKILRTPCWAKSARSRALKDSGLATLNFCLLLWRASWSRPK